jgi:hypothetical protein
MDNFGKYLPTPYIESIHLESTSGWVGSTEDLGYTSDDWPKCTIGGALFFKVDDNEDINKVLERLNSELNFYFLFVFTASDSAAAEGARAVIGGEENVFSYYDRFRRDGTEYDYASDVYLAPVDLNSFLSDNETDTEVTYSPTDVFYDESGDKIIKFNIEVERVSAMAPWETVKTLRIFAFSSTFNYFNDQDELVSELQNESFFDKQTGDIAYEPVIARGKLVNPFEVKFFDSDGVLYAKTPLQSISHTYHKANTITHTTIVGYFNNLLEQFVAEEHSQLKRMKDAISSVLATRGDKPDLIYQLNALRKMFPSKSRTTPVGKLYARFRKRIFSTNRDIKLNSTLFQKIVRNPKLFDERDPPVYTREEPSWVPDAMRTDANYLYSSGYLSRITMYSFPGANPFQTAEYDSDDAAGIDYTTVANTLSEVTFGNDHAFDAIVKNFGYFFFDYEKALRKVADVNQIVDIERLIRYGIPIDYKHFGISTAKITRPELTIDSSKQTSEADSAPNPDDFTSQSVEIIANFKSERSFPATITTSIKNNSNDRSLAVISPGFYGEVSTAQGAAALALTEEEHPYLMVRNFNPVQKRSWSNRIKDYRLVCFEFQDFMDDDVAMNRADNNIDYYTTTVVIRDNSIEILKEFVAKYKNTMKNLRDYRDRATALFSYDETTGLFNDFFIEGMDAIYSADETRAPWYRAPIIYNLHRDLLYNVFGGDMTALIEDAQSTMMNINPFNGTFFALDKFYKEMEKFYEDNYASTAQIGSEIGELAYKSPSLKSFTNILPYNSSGNTDEPYGVIYTEPTFTAPQQGISSQFVLTVPEEPKRPFVIKLINEDDREPIGGNMEKCSGGDDNKWYLYEMKYVDVAGNKTEVSAKVSLTGKWSGGVASRTKVDNPEDYSSEEIAEMLGISVVPYDDVSLKITYFTVGNNAGFRDTRCIETDHVRAVRSGFSADYDPYTNI